MAANPTPVPYSRTTRVFHAGIALSIATQLGSSLIMDPDKGGDLIFKLHQYSGLTAFSLVLGFWVLVMLRQRGTPLGLLVPWTSGSSLSALWTDIKAHFAALKSRQLPPVVEQAPLASAVHGLGLLLMTAMAASGALYYLVSTGDPDAGGWVARAMFVHTTLANLVWAYLIAHASVGILHHIFNHQSLRTMWSFGRNSLTGAKS